MRFVSAAIAVFVLADPAAAASLPNFDSAGYCAKVGSVGLTQSTIVLDGCIRQEVAARAELTGSWDSLTPAEQSHCLTAATFAGDGSYAAMRGCLMRLRSDAALDAAEGN